MFGSAHVKKAGAKRDITREVETELVIKESQQLLQQTFASLQDAIFIVDYENLTINDCNDAATEIFGYPREALIGKPFDVLHVDQEMLQTFQKHINEAIEKYGLLKGVGLEVFWPHVLAILGLGVVLAVVALATFNRALDEE